MVVASVVLTLLMQAPASASSASGPRDFAVLISRRLGVSEVRAHSVARKVVEHLKTQGLDRMLDPAASAKALGVMGVRDSAECEGKRDCMSGLGRVLRAWGVVAIDLADIDGTMAMHFEVLQSDTGEKLSVLDLALPSKKVEVELANQLKPLVNTLKAATPPPAEPVKATKKQPSDAPVASKLEPSNVNTTAEAPGMSKARVGALVTTAGALVGGGLVILFMAQAGTAQRQLDTARVERNGGTAYALPEAQARTLGTRVNDNYSAALGVGLGAAALAITSAVLWAQP